VAQLSTLGDFARRKIYMSDNSETSETTQSNSEREQLLQVARLLDQATANPSKGGKTDRLAVQIGDKTDQQLIDMLLAKPTSSTPEELDAVREELKSRSLEKLDKNSDQQLLDIVGRPSFWSAQVVQVANAELKRRGVALSTITPQFSPATDDNPKKPKSRKALRIVGWILFIIGALNIAANLEVRFMSMKPTNDDAISWMVHFGFIIAGLIMVTRK
jgi:hypothetical protein